MRRRWVLWMLVVLLAAAAASQVRLYFGYESRNQLQVLWSDKTAYICIGRVTHGGRPTLGGAAWCAWMGYFAPRWCDPDRQRRDLLVAEISSNGLQRTLLEDFPSGGGCYIYDGVLHYAIGARNPDEYPADWRWESDTFKKAAKDEALRMRATYRYISDLLAAEGWKEKVSWAPGEIVTLDIEGMKAEIFVEDSEQGVERVMLRLAPGPAEPMLVIQGTQAWLSRSDYLALPDAQ